MLLPNRNAEEDYERLCFVAMPFGVKEVNGSDIDFDRIYADILKPAIATVPLPEGGYLIPRRADEDFFSGTIDEDMFRYLEYSRFVLADITGLNFNVSYELGVRHRARESGTAIFQQASVPVPFDISHLRVFPYRAGTDADDEHARGLVADVLARSLVRNRLDSPVAAALRAQRERQNGTGRVDRLLAEAENAVRVRDLAAAIQAYRGAIELDPGNFTLHLEVGVLFRDAEDWPHALYSFKEAVRLEPAAAAAWRELGVALNKLHGRARDENPETGESELRRAIALDPHDFDAWASLGGVLKRKPDLEGALQAYERAVTESNGATYPLLNAMKLRAAEAGPLVLSDKDRTLLRRAQRQRAAQVAQVPPYDAPWSFFDLAEILLYLGDSDGFLDHLDEGILHCSGGWQAETFAHSLQLASLAGPVESARIEGVRRLTVASQALKL